MKKNFVLFIVPLAFFNFKQIKRTATHGYNWSTNAAVIASIPIAPLLSIADTRIVEGNAGLAIAQVMVSISQVSQGSVTVAYNTRNITAMADTDYVAANGTITFAPGEIMKRINVSIIGELICEDDEKFEIVLSDASGATVDANAGTATIVNDDCRRNNRSGPALPTNNSGSNKNGSGTTPNANTAGSANSTGNLSIYEVRLTHTGYTSFAGSPGDCSIRSNGKVVLSGLLVGPENVDLHDDILYTGTLQLDIDIDICSAMTEEAPGGGYPNCGITVVGSGPVKTELEVYFDGRGGYVKILNVSGRFSKSLSGSCDQAQINEERAMVPIKTIASIFNGRDLPMLTNRTLRVGRYVETDGQNETVVEVLRAVNP